MAGDWIPAKAAPFPAAAGRVQDDEADRHAGTGSPPGRLLILHSFTWESCAGIVGMIGTADGFWVAAGEKSGKGP